MHHRSLRIIVPLTLVAAGALGAVKLMEEPVAGPSSVLLGRDLADSGGRDGLLDDSVALAPVDAAEVIPVPLVAATILPTEKALEKKPLQGPPDDADLERLVGVLPAWSDGDEFFEKKYESFTRAQLREAEELLGPILHEESETVVQARITVGDYELPELSPDGSSNGFKEYPIEGVAFCARIMSIPQPDGSLTQVRMRFTPDTHPLIHYRAREQGWLANRRRE